MTDTEKLLVDHFIEKFDKRLGDFAHNETIESFEQDAIAARELIHAMRDDLLQLRNSLFSTPKGKRK